MISVLHFLFLTNPDHWFKRWFLPGTVVSVIDPLGTQHLSWQTLIVRALLCLRAIVLNHLGNVKLCRAFPDGVVLWPQLSGLYITCHALRTTQNGHRAWRDLVCWDVCGHQLHRAFQLDYVSTFSTNSTTYASSKHRRTPGFVRKKRYPKILVDFKIIVSQHKHCNLVCRSVLFADKQDKPRYRICIYIAKLKQ